jgi:predicted DNA-binding transcriptional regulator YafY
MLVYEVQASRFITVKKSSALIQKLTAMASRHQARELNRQLFVDNQVKTQNEQIYITLDLLHKAVGAGKKVSFMYYEYDRNKDKIYKHNGYKYAFSPYVLLVDSEKCYVAGYSDKHGGITTFRVDRIAKPRIIDTAAVPKPEDFDVSMYRRSIFQMYGGSDIQRVTLMCENGLMKNVIDIFGESVETEILDDNHFTASVEVSVSPTFFGWVFSFGGRMRILAPEQAAADYLAHARNIVEKTG